MPYPQYIGADPSGALPHIYVFVYPHYTYLCSVPYGGVSRVLLIEIMHNDKLSGRRISFFAGPLERLVRRSF
jgi:hypothetical protein